MSHKKIGKVLSVWRPMFLIWVASLVINDLIYSREKLRNSEVILSVCMTTVAFVSALGDTAGGARRSALQKALDPCRRSFLASICLVPIFVFFGFEPRRRLISDFERSVAAFTYAAACLFASYDLIDWHKQLRAVRRQPDESLGRPNPALAWRPERGA